MTLQAKLTLGSVALATIIVCLISFVDLINYIQFQFDATLERGELLKNVAAKTVAQALNRRRTVPLEEALRDRDLAEGVVDLMANSHAVTEIAVVRPDGEILADADDGRVGQKMPVYPDFQPVAKNTGWNERRRVLMQTGQLYQVERTLESQDKKTQLAVRVIIDPALIRNEVMPNLRARGRIAVVSIMIAVAITFLFSAFAFRPVGKLSEMLDLVAKGELVPEDLALSKKAGRDEFSVIASKVSLLGERLRGAQSEVSDLRGNFDRLLQDLEDAVLIFNREQRLVFASGAVEKFLGRPRSGLIGLPLPEIFPPSSALATVIAQAAQEAKPVRNRRLPMDGMGEVPIGAVLLSIDLLESLRGAATSAAGFLVRLRDPEATRRFGHELQTADRMAAISRITSGVAHEVKNPLNAMLLHSTVARNKLAVGNTEIGPEMEIIGNEIVRLDRVVKTFLDFTRPVQLNRTAVSLPQFLSELVELARPQADAGSIQIHLDEEVEGVEVRVDRDLMKQALLNIVVNAIESMPRGGEIRFLARLNDGAAEISISDTGSGIPEKLRDKIFKLYFTTKPAGSGIGLAMTFRIVQLHDGTIDFTSEPGKGTTFLVRLPAAV